MPKHPELLTVTEAAEYLGVTRQAIHKLTKQPYPGLGHQYGTVWLFMKEELDTWRDKPRTHGGRLPGSKEEIVLLTPVRAI